MADLHLVLVADEIAVQRRAARGGGSHRADEPKAGLVAIQPQLLARFLDGRL